MKKMKKLKSKTSLINIITTLLLQLVTIISGFIIPRIVLDSFGSNVNGLVSSLKQFLSYIAIIEGGLSGIVTANIYKPLIENDTEKLNRVLKTANSFYRKISYIFVLYSILLGLIYPIIVNTSFSFEYVFSLTIILSITLLSQNILSLTYKGLLTADKKVYVVSLIQIFIVIVNTIIVVVISNLYPNIHLLKLLSGIVYLLQPILFGIYIKNNYKLDMNVKKDNKLISERWNGFVINIASFIHSSTDVSILTIFTNLESVSIYSIYHLITSGISQMINSVASAITPTIGQAYAKNNKEELYSKLNIYEYIIVFLVFFFYSISMLLITPFVLIYTSGITDANYNQPVFGVLLVISEMLYLLKLPHLNLAYSANKFMNITKPAYIEALINIIVSIILVSKFGLIGVAIGTIVAMIYRLVFHIGFTKKLINRSQLYFYKKIIVFMITSFIGIVFCYYIIPLRTINISAFLIHAVIYSLIFVILFFLSSLLFFKKELSFFKNYLKINNKK